MHGESHVVAPNGGRVITARSVSTAKQRLSVAVIVASQIAPPMMFSGVAVALPHMGTALGAGAIELGLVETLFFAGSVALLLPVGRLADATDKRTIYKVGLLCFGLVSALIGMVSWMPLILLLRFVQGALTATLGAAGPALLAELVPPERRGRVFGASLGAIYVGLTLGPIVAGLLLKYASWRAVFGCGAGLLLLMSLAIALSLESRWRPSTRSAQLPSTVLVGFAVAGLVGGSATLERPLLGGSLLVIGVALAIAFVLLQRRLDDPLLDVRALVGDRVLRNAVTVQLLLYTSAHCTVFVLSLVLQISLGLAAETAGLLLAIGSTFMAVTAPIAGALADRVRPRLIATIGVCAALASAALATRIGLDTAPAYIALVIGLQGLGFGLFASPNMTIVMNCAQPETSGAVSAVSATARSLGMIIGVLMIAVLISLEIGNARVQDHPIELIEIAHSAFWLLTGTITAALLLSLLAPRHRTSI